MIQACRLNRAAEFDTLVNAGVPVDSRDNLGNTPLIITAQHGHLLLAQRCVRQGADLNAVNDRGLTALMYACAFGRVKLAATLLEVKAGIEIVDRNRRSALHYAAAEGYSNCVLLLRQYGAHVEVKDAAERTPLHYAACGGDPACVQTLAEGGAFIDSRDEERRTPLHHCVEGDKVDCVPTLMEHGADVNATDSENWTPLHWAARKGSLRCLQLLISLSKSAVDCIAVDTFYWTALHHAASGGYAACVSYLAEQLPGMRGAKDKFGRTPLHVAVMEGHADCVVALCEAGADVERRDDQGCTPLHVAAAEARAPCLSTLVKHGAYLESLDNWNRTALHWAAQAGSADCVFVLRCAGADYKAMDGDGFSPLHIAAVVNIPETINALVVSQCPPNLKDLRDRTALHHTAELGHVEAALELLKLGAREFVLDDQNRSAFDIAELSGHTSWIEACKKLQASIRIQATFRGKRGRKVDFPLRIKHLQQVREVKAALIMQCWARKYILAPNRVKAQQIKMARKNVEHKAASLLQRIFRGHRGRNKAKRAQELKLRIKATYMLQRQVRRRLAKMRMQKHREQTKAAIKIQRIIRGRQAQKEINEKRAVKAYWKAIERIHYYVRRRRAKIMRLQMANEQLQSVIQMQAAWRGRVDRKFVKEKKKRHLAAIKIQGMYRQAKARGAVKRRCKEIDSVQTIQRAYKRHLDWAAQKRIEAERVASLTTVQSLIRQMVARRRAKVRRKWNESAGVDVTAAIIVTRYIRRHGKRLQLRAVMTRRNQAASIIQKCARGYISRVKFRLVTRKAMRKRRQERLSAEIMQSLARGFLVRKELMPVLLQRSDRRHAAACLLARCLMGHVGRCEARRRRERRDAATLVQTRLRMKMAKKRVTQIRNKQLDAFAPPPVKKIVEVAEEEEEHTAEEAFNALTPEEQLAIKRERAATKIQSVGRGRLGRNRVAKLWGQARNVYEHVERNNYQDVVEALQKGHNVNAANKAGETLLTLSAMHNRKRITVLCLEYKANVNHTNKHGQTALHQALLYKHQEIAEELIAQGANVEAADVNGMRPVHCAMDGSKGLPPTLGCLEACTLHGADVNSVDHFGVGVVHQVASTGVLDMLQAIVDRDCDPSIVTKAGKQAIHYAAEKGNLEISEKLYVRYNANLDKPDNTGFTALHYSALNGHIDCVRYFIKCNADCTVMDAHKRTAMMNAAANGYIECLNELLPMSAVDAKDDNMWTALHFACDAGHLKCAEALCAAGADVDLQDTDGMTPMHFAATHGHVHVIDMLIKSEGNPRTADAEGWTALTFAANEGQFEATQFLVNTLLQKGASLKEMVDKDGRTPLIEAACGGHIAVVKCLVEKGFDINAQDHNGMTALMHACTECQVDVTRALVQLGADAAIVNNDEKAAQDIALRQNLLPLLQALSGV